MPFNSFSPYGIRALYLKRIWIILKLSVAKPFLFMLSSGCEKTLFQRSILCPVIQSNAIFGKWWKDYLSYSKNMRYLTGIIFIPNIITFFGYTKSNTREKSWRRFSERINLFLPGMAFQVKKVHSPKLYR